jgi:hypothetical protein
LNPELSPQCEKFLIEQSRKFLFKADGPIEVGEETGAIGIERKGTGSAEGSARSRAGAFEATAGGGTTEDERAGFPQVMEEISGEE